MDQAGSGLVAEPALSGKVAWRPPEVPSTVNHPAMEDGGFGKPPWGCLPALPWPGQWGHVAGRVLILRGIFPPFPRLLSEPWVWIQAGILQDAPEGR